MKKFNIIKSLILGVAALIPFWSAMAEKPQNGWKGGISYTSSLEKKVDYKRTDKTFLISLNGGYRHNFSEYFFAEGNLGLFYQGFPKSEKSLLDGVMVPEDYKAHSWGLGLEPEALIGAKLWRYVEISTGPSVQYMFAIHRNSWDYPKKRFFALWNFRAGTTVGRFNPYAEFQLPLSDFAKHIENNDMNYYLRFGLNYCF